MQLPTQKTLISLLLFYIFPLVIILHSLPSQGKRNLLLQTLQLNTTNTTTYSPWLTRIDNRGFPGCRWRPWICNQGGFPRTRRLCCRNRCVDVTSDVNNCGLCGIRCRYTRQCCRGLCVNTNRNPFHCGRCDRRCRFPSLCIYGMCGYAQPLPPFPFPPRRPKPPCPPHGWRRGPPPLG